MAEFWRLEAEALAASPLWEGTEDEAADEVIMRWLRAGDLTPLCESLVWFRIPGSRVLEYVGDMLDPDGDTD